MSIWKSMGMLLLSGSFFCTVSCGNGRVEQGVFVQGVAVGGMTYAEAERAVREEIAQTLPPLVIGTPQEEIVVGYPRLSFTDDVSKLLRRAKKGEQLTASVQRTWADAEVYLEGLCAQYARDAVDAQLTFSSDGFTYTAEEMGTACDYSKLLDDVFSALQSGEERVELSVREFAPAVCEQDLREKTQLLSEFTTHFNANNRSRTENIRLSASRISGTVLAPGAEFSFNGTVGARTAENGFQQATVIENGVFTEGIGGGVCQTSTTLFNAALLAGMKITESRNHSLSIGYVSPSLDAMVSEFSDLKFRNTSSETVYLLSEVKGNAVTFRFYGLPSGLIYRTESRTLMRLSPPPPKVIEGTEEKIIRAEKSGLVSESYLLTYSADGTLLSRERIRKDSYSTVQGIYQVVPE